MEQSLQNSNIGGVFFITADQLEQYGMAVAQKVLEKFKASTTNDPTADLLTVDDVSKRLHINRVTIWRWEREGYLKPKKIGRKKYYRQSDIERLADQNM